MEDARGEDRADRPVLHQRPHRGYRRRAAQVMVRPEDHACFVACQLHRDGVIERQRERLLAQDVLAGAGGRDRLRRAWSSFVVVM